MNQKSPLPLERRTKSPAATSVALSLGAMGNAARQSRGMDSTPLYVNCTYGTTAIVEVGLLGSESLCRANAGIERETLVLRWGVAAPLDPRPSLATRSEQRRIWTRVDPRIVINSACEGRSEATIMQPGVCL